MPITNRPRLRRHAILRVSAAVLIAAVLIGAPAAGAVQITAVGPLVAADFEAASAGPQVKYYVVRDAYQGEPEFLFEIADRFLGDGDRNPEIFQLNVGRLQPDGGRLTQADVILPDWILVLPEDAKGAEIQTGVLPKVEPVASPESSTGSSNSPVLWIAGGATLLLGVLLIGYGLVVINRGAPPVPTGVGSGRAPSPPPAPERSNTPRRWLRRARSEAEPLPRSFDAAAAWTVDRALRSLSGLVVAADRALPSFYAVSLDADLLRLRLAVPDHEPPAPWTAEEDGLTWMASLRALQTVPLDDRITAPSPRLVTLGMDGGTRVLLDLGQATGVITIEGPAAGVRAMLQGWITELAVAPWADQVRIVVVGIEIADGPRSSNRVRMVPGPREALAAVGTSVVGWSGGGSVAGVLRGGSAAGDSVPGVLVFGAGARGSELEQIQALAGRPDAGWAVVFVGRAPGARWRFTLGSDGRLDTGVLGLRVRVTDGTPATVSPGR